MIHLACPPKNQVVLWEMCKWRTQCPSAGVGGSISNTWRERYRNPLCIRDTPPSRKMWDIKPLYKAPSPATGAKKPQKDQSRTRQIGKPYWNCTKESSKTKKPQKQQNRLLFAKKKDNKHLAFVFRRPKIFFGSKNVRTFGTFERGFRVPTTFTFSLIPLVGATWLSQVFAMLGQFSLCFRMILQPKL